MAIGILHRHRSISPARPKPQKSNQGNGEVWCEEEIEYPKIYPGSNARVALANVVFQRGAAHGALGGGTAYQWNENEKKKDEAFHT